MKRRRLLVGLAVVTTTVVAAALLWPRGPQPCRATFAQVRKGMTQSEIAAVVGGPPGYYCDRPESPIIVTGINNYAEQWVAHDSNLVVWYDASLMAREVIITDPGPDNRSPAERLWDRLNALTDSLIPF